MRRFLPLMLLFSISTSPFLLNGQDILLEELFNDGTLGMFSEFSVVGSGQNWEPREFDGKQFTQMNGFDGGIQDNEDWLISPALDMDAYEDEVLTFENAANFDGPNLEVLVSTDYDGTSDPNTASWTDLSSGVTWSGGDFEYVESGELDLSSFSGTGYIAFKYISNADVQGKLWQIDSVVVRATMLINSVDDISAERPMIANLRVQADYLTFDLLAEEPSAEFAIYSVNGQLLDQFQQAGFPGTVQHSVATLPAGMYVLQVRSPRGRVAFKFSRS